MIPLAGSRRMKSLAVTLFCLALALALPLTGGPWTGAADGAAVGRVSDYGLDGSFHPWQPMVASLAVYKDTLYVGTSKEGAADIWSWDGMGWKLENPPSFWSAGTYNHLGCEIWPFDGSSWKATGKGGSGTSTT